MKKSAISGLILLLAVGALFGYLYMSKSTKIDFMTLFVDKGGSEWLTVNSTLRDFLDADYAQQHFLCTMLAELNFTHEGRKYDEWAWWYYLTSFDELAKDDVYGKATIEEILYWTVVAAEESGKTNIWEGRRSISADQNYNDNFSHLFYRSCRTY
jgi:hypothetical protein